MYCKGRFYVDGFDYPMLRCRISIPGYSINKSGAPRSVPPAPKFHIELESRQETHLLRWITDGQIKDHVKLEFESTRLDQRNKFFDLHDVTCVKNEEDFWSENTRPMTNSITLIPAILIAQGVLVRVQGWHIQNPKSLMGGSTVEATERPVTVVDEEEKFIEAYLLDKDNQPLSIIEEPQSITLVIKTKGKIGKSIKSISLHNEEYDYIYQGKVLKNDTLTGYVITSDEDHIPLEVIEQTNQNN